MDTTTVKRPHNHSSKSELEKFKLFYEYVIDEKDDQSRKQRVSRPNSR